MSEPDAVVVDGRVSEALPNALFRVELAGGELVLVHLSSRLRMGTGRILPGDRVQVALSAFDRSRGRIVGRDR
ncbi:MAG: translation initiation factor IF-1 [Chloroflexota bacterium]